MDTKMDTAALMTGIRLTSQTASASFIINMKAALTPEKILKKTVNLTTTGGIACTGKRISHQEIATYRYLSITASSFVRNKF